MRRLTDREIEKIIYMTKYSNHSSAYTMHILSNEIKLLRSQLKKYNHNLDEWGRIVGKEL